MSKKAKRITKIVISSVTGIILLMTLYIMICSVVAMQKEKPVKIFGYSYSYVPTPSMEPTIKAGDSIIFKSISYDSCKVGDIIVYKSQAGETKGMYILHRINQITDEGFITKGDNNYAVDPEIVTKDMLVGKYSKTFNFLNVGKLINNKNVIYGLLILFFLGILVMESVNICLIRQKKKQIKSPQKIQTEDEIREELLKEMREELLKELQGNDKEDE